MWPCSGKEPSVSEAASLSHTSLYKQLIFFSVLLLSTSPPFSLWFSVSAFQAFQPPCFHGLKTKTRMLTGSPNITFQQAFLRISFVFSCRLCINNNKISLQMLLHWNEDAQIWCKLDPEADKGDNWLFFLNHRTNLRMVYQQWTQCFKTLSKLST